MRYKVWRCHGDPEKMLHVMIVADPPQGPDTNWNAHVPDQVRSGPWVGGPEGRLSRLKPHYRALLREQGFVVLNCRPAALDLERPRRRRWRLRVGQWKVAPGQGRGNSRGPLRW